MHPTATNPLILPPHLNLRRTRMILLYPSKYRQCSRLSTRNAPTRVASRLTAYAANIQYVYDKNEW